MVTAALRGKRRRGHGGREEAEDAEVEALEEKQSLYSVFAHG